jgi:hypothetical protein
MGGSGGEMVLLPLIWEKGSKGSGIQGFKCLFSKDFTAEPPGAQRKDFLFRNNP